MPGVHLPPAPRQLPVGCRAARCRRPRGRRGGGGRAGGHSPVDQQQQGACCRVLGGGEGRGGGAVKPTVAAGRVPAGGAPWILWGLHLICWGRQADPGPAFGTGAVTSGGRGAWAALLQVDRLLAPLGGTRHPGAVACCLTLPHLCCRWTGSWRCWRASGAATAATPPPGPARPRAASRAPAPRCRCVRGAAVGVGPQCD